jgi:hypothetical protein
MPTCSPRCGSFTFEMIFAPEARRVMVLPDVSPNEGHVRWEVSDRKPNRGCAERTTCVLNEIVLPGTTVSDVAFYVPEAP